MLRRVLRLARKLCAIMYHQNGDLANLLKSAQKKSAQSARLQCAQFLIRAESGWIYSKNPGKTKSFCEFVVFVISVRSARYFAVYQTAQ